MQQGIITFDLKGFHQTMIIVSDMQEVWGWGEIGEFDRKLRVIKEF